MKLIITESQLKRLISEQSRNFPIFNNTNQTATGKEKIMVDNLNKWLNWLVNKNIDYMEKEKKVVEVLGYFSPKCVIIDEALYSIGLPRTYTSPQDWYDTVIMFQLTDQANKDEIKYQVGVKYFSLDGNNKISNVTLG